MKEDLYFLGVKAIIRNSEGKVLLLRANKEIFKDKSKPVYWDVPGGRVQKNVSIEDTLKREVEEETGIADIRITTPFSIVVSNIRVPTENGETHGLILSAYLCEVNNDISVVISDEHDEYGWFEPVAAAELLKVKYPNEFVNKIASL